MKNLLDISLEANEAVSLANTLLGRLQHVFEAQSLCLARACAKQNRLDATQVDAYQTPCFDLAWVSAELLAARTSLETRTGKVTGLPVTWL